MSKIDEQCRALWKEAFGDNDSFIEQFMNRYYNPENLLHIGTEKKLFSMLHLIPFDYNNGTIGIIYALATATEERSRGYATILIQRAIETAQKRGYTHIALIPASEQLFSYYNKRGFKGKYRVEFILPDDFDFGIDDKENQWLTVMPLLECSPLPSTKHPIVLTWNNHCNSK